MQYEQEVKVAITAAKQAAMLCEQVQQSSFLRAMDKSDRSPVTIADFGAQAIICQAIARAFPQDAIVAEENSYLLAQSPAQLAAVTQFVRQLQPDTTDQKILHWIDLGQGQVGNRFWTLDPIDGTKGFLRGDQYAIAIALIESGEVQLGVMACPKFQDGYLFVAVRGQGTQMISLNSESHSASSSQPPPALRLTESIETSHGNPTLQRAVAQAIGLTLPPLQLDSQTKYGAIAAGQAALYMRLPWVEQPHYQENIWDHATGAIVVEEAGGQVTDMDGKRLDFTASTKLVHNRGIVASRGIAHDQVLAAIQSQTRSSSKPEGSLGEASV